MCTVLIFLSDHVDLSRDILKLSNASEERSEFIWYLKEDDDIYLKNAYLRLVLSCKPGIYLQIQNFLDVVYICLPCLEDDISSPVDKPDKPATVTDIRRNWEKLHHNLRQVKILVPQLREEPFEISSYFHPGQSAPCAQYPKQAKEFYPNACVLLVLSNMKNFTMPFGRISNYLKIHSQIRIGQLIDGYNIKLWKSVGFMGKNYLVEFTHFAFTTFIKKQVLRSEQSEATKNLIFSPFPWWTWFSIVAFSLATSLLLSPELDSLRARWTTATFEFFNFIILLIDQPIPRISWNRQLIKLALTAAWCFFCLLVSNAHRGLIFSCLATVIKATHPETLAELIKTKIVAGTSDYSYISSDVPNPSKQSLLIDNILPDIIAGLKSQENVYSALRDSLQQFDYDLVELCVQSCTNKSFPDKFAFIDPLWRNHKARNIFDEAKSYWISKSITEPTLVYRIMWTASYNYFYPIWCSALARVYESGMQGWWDAYVKSHNEKLGKARVLKRLSNTTGEDDETKSEHEVPRQVYVQLFTYFGMLVGTASLIFIMEICRRHCRNVFGSLEVVKLSKIFYGEFMHLGWE